MAGNWSTSVLYKFSQHHTIRTLKIFRTLKAQESHYFLVPNFWRWILFSSEYIYIYIRNKNQLTWDCTFSLLLPFFERMPWFLAHKNYNHPIIAIFLHIATVLFLQTLTNSNSSIVNTTIFFFHKTLTNSSSSIVNITNKYTSRHQ